MGVRAVGRSRGAGRSRGVRPRHRPGEQASTEREEDHDRGDHRRLTPERTWLRALGSRRRNRSRNDTRHRRVCRGDEHRGRLAVKRGQQRVPVGRSLGRVLLSAASARAARSGGASGSQLGDGGRSRVQMHVQQGERLVGDERQRARQHPEENHAERVDVARRRRPARRQLAPARGTRPCPGRSRPRSACPHPPRGGRGRSRRASSVLPRRRGRSRASGRDGRDRGRGAAPGRPRCPWRCGTSRRPAEVPSARRSSSVPPGSHSSAMNGPASSSP